jgi:hypothetical protein
MTKNEIDGACNTYGGEEICIEVCDGETWWNETTETQASMRVLYQNGYSRSGMAYVSICFDPE